jgi:NAD(P)-dependent dehydrogenase (short-subunit alcohol dehydrogenase family)
MESKMELNLFQDLKGKVCVLTGGGGVIGTTLAMGLGKAGVKVAVLDIKKELAVKVAELVTKESGTKAIGVEANVLDKNSLLSAYKIVISELGPVDILLNGAGGNSPMATTKSEFITDDKIDQLNDTFFGLEIEGFQKVFDLNFLGTLLPTMVFAKDMICRKSGVVLNISSMNSFRPLTKIPAYSAAKSSVNNFTQWLAVHFAKMDVRVNAIAPGFFLTDQNRFLLIDEKNGALTARGNKIMLGTPMGRFGETEDLIGTVLYLISDLSKFVTGVVIPVDGGFSAYSGV